MLKKLIIVVLSVALIFLIGSGVYVYTLIDQVIMAPVEGGTASADETDNGLNRTDHPDDIVNIMLFGVDRRSADERGRSDTIMIATVDKKHNNIKLTSLMRDIYMSIPGYRDNRLNAAFALGGPSLSMRTVNENFDLDIQRYVVIDFMAFEKIIDVVDGVSIDIKSSEIRALNRNLDDIALIDGTNSRSLRISNAGVQSLNGRQALAYARIRDVGNDDFDRVNRQQIVLSNLFEQVKSLNPLKFPELISTVFPHVETNLTTMEILGLGTNVLGFRDKQIYRFRVPVEGTFAHRNIRGMSVLMLNIDENIRLLHEFLFGDPAHNAAQ